jgi:hypothetical protein
LKKAQDLGQSLLASSIPGYRGHCWGYPFDWRQNLGLWKKNTPFITTTPYCFELFAKLFDVTGEKAYLDIARSIADFVHQDLLDTPTSETAAASGYAPQDHSLVINASAYRAMVLFDAARRFGKPEYSQAAARNLNFVLENQRPDGAWLYSLDEGERFIDHFHTCFVLKNLWKIKRHVPDTRIEEAIQRGYAYYRRELFDLDGLPKPFAVKPRIQFTQINMYDVAESISLGVMLRDEVSGALEIAQRLTGRLCRDWQLPQGYFVTFTYVGGLRHTLPYLRWPQAPLFYALTNFLQSAALSPHDKTPDSFMTHNPAEGSKPRNCEQLQKDCVTIALQTLPRMLVSPEGPFCLELAKGNYEPRFDSDKSWRYTIMCLLGLARAEQAGLETHVNVKRIYDRTLALLPELGPGELGLLLWMATRIKSDQASAIAQEMAQKLEAGSFGSLAGMEVAWIMTGSATFHHHSGAKESPAIQRLVDYFFANRVSPSGLVYHLGAGFRRRFPNFATQIYSLHALSMRARLCQEDRCGQQAQRLASRLQLNQRDNGGWPWLYDAKTGGVVEPFEVYSVHQHGMAPMAFLELAEATGADVSQTLAKSLAWLNGQNELQFQMIAPETGLIYRSIRRRKPNDRLEIFWRVLRSSLGATPGALFPQSPSRLEVNFTCRPYELAWLLEAWTGRRLINN